MTQAVQTRRRTTRRPPPRFEQFVAVRRFQPVITFSRDGRRVLYVTDTSGQFNLWRSPVRGGTPEQLTAFEEHAVRSVSVTPDASEIVFTADRHGDEFHQIYSLPYRGGWPEQLTDAEQVQHFLDQAGWSPDGAALAFAANARTPTDMDVWLRDRETGEVKKLFGENMYAFPLGWSHDGTRLLVVDARSNSDSSIHLVYASTGVSEELTPHEGDVKYIPGPWAADDSGFYLLSDEGREYTGLAHFDLDQRRLDWVDAPEADVLHAAGSEDGRVLAWIVNERGWGTLRFRDLESGRDLPDVQLPRGALPMLGGGLTLSADGRYAATLWMEPRRPSELYVIETATGRAKRITDSMLGGLRPRDLVDVEETSYPSFDGREIPAWLYRPKRKRRQTAVVLAIHGGPEAQERPRYYPLYQYLTSRGVAVLAPNIRGSTGYGKSYQSLIHHDWGGADLKDMEHAAKWLREQDWIDADRIGIFGISYGGFATLSCVTRLPEYWAVGAEGVGPANLVTFSKAVPPTWRRFMAKWVGDPETEADFLMERSPISYVDNVRVPLLVLQGAKDPRVVKGESDQMVEKLRALGREVEYVVFEDEGHGFTKRRNEIEAERRIAEWLERHLVG